MGMAELSAAQIKHSSASRHCKCVQLSHGALPWEQPLLGNYGSSRKKHLKMCFPPKLSESTHQWVFQAWETYAKSTDDMLYWCTNHTALGYTKPHPPKPFLQLLPLLKKAQIFEECVWSEFILLCSLRALISTILPHPGRTQKKACNVMNEYILAEQPQHLIKQRFKLKM